MAAGIALGLFFILAGKTIYKRPLIYINLTRSTPVGLYAARADPLGAGDYCLVPRGAIATDKSLPKYLVKTVAALEGAKITREKGGVRVGGIFYPCAEGENITTAETVEAGMVFVAGTHKKSYDSRYFGPLPANSIKRAVLIWRF